MPLSGFADLHADIDNAGGEAFAIARHDLRPIGHAGGALDHARDPAGLHQQRPAQLPPRHRVDQAGVGEDDIAQRICHAISTMTITSPNSTTNAAIATIPEMRASLIGFLPLVPRSGTCCAGSGILGTAD